MPEEFVPVPKNRPAEGEIPDILEWKLDVIMAQLARLGGGLPAEHDPVVGGTRQRLPPVDAFDPEVDEFPNYPGIPKVLEWKLDVLIVQLARLIALVTTILPWLALIAIILVVGFAAVVALLTIIAGLLTDIQALLLFVVVQIAVPFIIARNRRKLRPSSPGSTP